MHPYDLVISKMMRWKERDAADAALLQSLFPFKAHEFGSRLNQAVEESMVQDWSKQQLIEILEELFFDEEELAIARTATPGLDAR